MSEHSCDSGCQECRQLQPNQTEVIMASYGYTDQPIHMNRQAAERYASQLVNKVYVNLKIVATRLDDNPANPSQGQVIAICEPVEPQQKPYKPRMEYK